MKKNILASFISFFLFSFSYASHETGGNITYECVGPNTFVLTLTIYEDCYTAFMTNSPKTIIAQNDCGLTSPTVTLPNIVYQQPVSNCPSNSCNGGVMPGFYIHIWQDTIVLPDTCDSWVFAYSNCCWNPPINISGTSNFMYFETVMNSNVAPCNSSPTISSQPNPLYCINQQAYYNLSVYDPDGDSLYFSLVDLMISSTTTAPYQPGYSGSAPIIGITFNNQTGEMSFTSSTVGNYVVSVLIEEFNDNGDFIGSTTHNFIVLIYNCSNNYPQPSGLVSNITGNVSQTGSTSLLSCVGDSFCFDIEFTDDITDSIFLNSNVNQYYPNATFVQNTFVSPATATICLTQSQSSHPLSLISISAIDNGCPNQGLNYMLVDISLCDSSISSNNNFLVNSISSSVNIYPNPVTDILFFDLNNINKPCMIQVNDLRGRSVFSAVSDFKSFNFDTSNLRPGIYIIKISNSGTLEEHKFIKQ